MKREARQLSSGVKNVVTYSSATAFLGYCFLAVGFLALGLIAAQILHVDPKAKANLIVAVFPVAGFALVLHDRKRVRKNLDILKYGSVAKGRFESKKKKTEYHRGQNGGSVSEYHLHTYRFDSEGRPGRYAQARTLWDKESPDEVTILYDPAAKSGAIVLELQPGGMRLEDSVVKGGGLLGVLALVLPISVGTAAVMGAWMALG